MPGCRVHIATLLIATVAACQPSPGAREAQPTEPASRDSPEVAAGPRQEYLRRACGLPSEWIERIDRGWDRGRQRDHDLVIVPRPPNFAGSLSNTSHSGPYGFLQRVPLILYGPGFVRAVGSVSLGGDPTIADLAPTYARLMGFDAWPRRDSAPLTQVLQPTRRAPRLIVTAVIDGGGWNVLRRWPHSWPNIRRLMRLGASVKGATVGSSPSITPATHTNIGTGAWPSRHGVTSIAVRADDGDLVGAFAPRTGDAGPAGMDPRVSLRVPTLADLWDGSTGNRAKAGLLAPGNLQLGMLGHGSALPGGDKDVALILSRGSWATNPEFYSLPRYVDGLPGPEADLDAVDRADGRADGRWRGHDIAPIDASPAFAPWQNRTLKAVLARERFGRDRVTDLFYVNYKAPDKAGHLWNMIAPEQKDVLASVDAAIGDLASWLERRYGEGGFVLAVTADHGQTPLDAEGWAISRGELSADINRAFDRLDNGVGVVQRTSASSLFMDAAEMRRNGVKGERISTWLSRYTIGDNLRPEGRPPASFESQLDERVFAAVFPGRAVPEVVRCANGRKDRSDR